MKNYGNSDVVGIMIGMHLDDLAQRFMEYAGDSDSAKSEDSIKFFISMATRSTVNPLPVSHALELYSLITKLEPFKYDTDLYDLPQEIVVKFWKNFENRVRTISNSEDKQRFICSVMDTSSTVNKILLAFHWDFTPEGPDYWSALCEDISRGVYERFKN